TDTFEKTKPSTRTAQPAPRRRPGAAPTRATVDETPRDTPVPRGDANTELPPIPENHVRVVHRTRNPNLPDVIAEEGLDYSQQGMITSTADVRPDTDRVAADLRVEDPRFSGGGVWAVVMDLPADEFRIHNDSTRSPGKVPPN